MVGSTAQGSILTARTILGFGQSHVRQGVLLVYSTRRQSHRRRYGLAYRILLRSPYSPFTTRTARPLLVSRSPHRSIAQTGVHRRGRSSRLGLAITDQPRTTSDGRSAYPP